MDRSKCNVSEIQIVDAILGHLSEEDHHVWQQHLATCDDCQRRVQEWRQHLLGAPNHLPSSRVYRRLSRRVRLRNLQRKWFRPAPIMGAACAATVMVLLAGMFSLYQEQPPSVPPTASSNLSTHAEHLPLSMVLDARTISFPIASQHAQSAGIYGQVWVNGHTDEMFFRLQGLIHDQEHDYQVWLIKSIHRENAGLLQMDGKYAELYTQGQNLRDVKFISVSKEPKGGSIAPTAPEIILLDFIPVHNVPGPRPE